MNRGVVSSTLCILLALLVSCASNSLLPNEIRFTHLELSERLTKRFPIEKNVAGLLDIKLTRPRIDAGVETGRTTRLVFTVDADVKLPLTGKNASGSVIISGVPRYNTATREIFLTDTKLDSLRADNMPNALSAAITRAAADIARDYLDGKAIYSFKEDDLRRYGLTLNPQRIDVRREGIVLIMR